MIFDDLSKKLKKNGFDVSVFETKEDATAYLDSEIDGKTIGVGGSMTVKDMDLLPILAKHNTIYSHGYTDLSREEMLRQAMTTDVYILSANGISADKGEIINIDGTGNRVSSSLFGHKKVYFVAGKNKISPTFHEAFDRIRNVIAPKNAVRLNKETPCKYTGKCEDCSCPDRMCNALVVFMKKVRAMDMEVILINEDLGY